MSTTNITESEVDFLLEVFQDRPEEFIIEVLGELPWETQVEIIQSVFKYKLTAVKTCNAIGKSFIAARIVIAFLMIHPGSIVVTTAPTWRQVTDILWREIATAVKKAELRGFKLSDKEVTQAGLSLDTDWYAVGLSTSRPENFFGYHADFILVVVDEAGGVDEPIFKGVAAITPNINAHVLLIGNPTSPTGTFFDAFTKPELGYNRITVSAFMTPNFTSTGITTVEKLLEVYTPRGGISQAEWTARVDAVLQKKMNPVYVGLISPSVVYSRYHEWGLDSPAWQSLVMGEFPSEAEQALIPTHLITQAMEMSRIDEESGLTFAELSGWNIPDGAPEYGQDMARMGNDMTVNIYRHGGWVENIIGWSKTDLMESANKILNIIDPMDFNVRINIDDTGNGGGTTDRLRQISKQLAESGQAPHQYQLAAYNFSSKEYMKQPEKFHDITAELYWNLRGWFIRKEISIPKDQRLFDELAGRRWFINRSGKIQVESKDDYKKRTGGKSPDYSDALALAFASGNRTPTNRQPLIPTRKSDTDSRGSGKMTPITSGLNRGF
ncbi:MAG: hypothetical protein KGZ81_07360 [Flavobacteriales bacterium]|nr:hypothetical protein [Flavobacteriales bacterium]